MQAKRVKLPQQENFSMLFLLPNEILFDYLFCYLPYHTLVSLEQTGRELKTLLLQWNFFHRVKECSNLAYHGTRIPDAKFYCDILLLSIIAEGFKFGSENIVFQNLLVANLPIYMVSFNLTYYGFSNTPSDVYTCRTWKKIFGHEELSERRMKSVFSSSVKGELIALAALGKFDSIVDNVSRNGYHCSNNYPKLISFFARNYSKEIKDTFDRLYDEIKIHILLFRGQKYIQTCILSKKQQVYPFTKFFDACRSDVTIPHSKLFRPVEPGLSLMSQEYMAQFWWIYCSFEFDPKLLEQIELEIISLNGPVQDVLKAIRNHVLKDEPIPEIQDYTIWFDVLPKLLLGYTCSYPNVPENFDDEAFHTNMERISEPIVQDPTAKATNGYKRFQAWYAKYFWEQEEVE